MNSAHFLRAWIAMLMAGSFALSQGGGVRPRMLPVERLKPVRAVAADRPRPGLA
jgi:hypothetical protein